MQQAKHDRHLGIAHQQQRHIAGAPHAAENAQIERVADARKHLVRGRSPARVCSDSARERNAQAPRTDRRSTMRRRRKWTARPDVPAAGRNGPAKHWRSAILPGSQPQPRRWRRTARDRPAASPASRDECATAAAAPASEPPIFSATTGLPAAWACKASARNRRAIRKAVDQQRDHFGRLMRDRVFHVVEHRHVGLVARRGEQRKAFAGHRQASRHGIEQRAAVRKDRDAAGRLPLRVRGVEADRNRMMRVVDAVAVGTDDADALPPRRCVAIRAAVPRRRHRGFRHSRPSRRSPLSIRRARSRAPPGRRPRRGWPGRRHRPVPAPKPDRGNTECR